MTPSTVRQTCRAARAALAAVAVAAAPALAQTAVIPSAIPALRVVDPTFVNRSANACGDFFDYANGAWLARDTIPAAYSSSGVGRDMGDRNELVVRSVLDDAMKRRTALPASSTQRKLGTFYATCMDSAAAERSGVGPLRPTLARIDAVTTKPALLRAIAALQSSGVNVAFNFGPEVDAHDAAHYLAGVYQGGLGLPDRDYYTRAGAGPDSLRRAYVDHVTRLLTLAGATEPSARADAERVMALETEMAKASLTRVQRRDPAATDHPMTVDSLKRLAPSVDWPAYFRARGVTRTVARLNVGMPAYMQRINRLVDSVPLSTWKAYLRSHAVSGAASWLSTPFVDENFAFSQRFSGAKTMLPRWKRCLRLTDGTIGEALGQAYVAETFSPDARARARAVIDDIRASFAERVKALTWMSDTTKKQALEKLSLMHEKIGYPESWRDYSTLSVAEGPFISNLWRAEAFEWTRVANRPGIAVDTTEWGMTVPTVNAYYNPSMNEMVFPAGALSPQTFDAKADDAGNYGSLGASWAGHELTHGFDDEGRHYDAHGNLRDWWTPADSLEFSRQATVVAEQFNGYVAVDTFHVNGRLTLGENIADYGGLLTAYDALQRALARNGRPGPIDGFTPEQRFFLGYAQSWRNHARDESMRTQVLTDPHAPARWRVNGPLSNIPAFAQAFGCKPGDAMVRSAAQVPRIW